MYTVCMDGKDTDETFRALKDAVEFAEGFLGPGTVVNEETGEVVASMTDQRIIGTFTKQTSEDGGSIEDVGEIKFDATSEVLSLDYEDLLGLKDHDYSTDHIGQQLVQ